MTQSNWYCKLPWTGFSNDPDGKVRPCCLFKDHIKDDSGKLMYVQTHTVKEIFSSNYMKSLRQRFRDGEKPSECQTCIIDESNGYTSKRQRYNDEPKIDFDQEPDTPIEYQMILSNACNLKCRSCTPSHSSLWQAEHKVIWGNTGYEMPHGQCSETESLLWSKRSDWMTQVRRLEIVGGEPFYINRWQTLWNEMIDQGLSKDIVITMSSNGTIYGGDTIKKLVENFKSVGLGLSIDGIGRTYEYLRHPASWEQVLENCLKYHQLKKQLGTNNLGVSISHTIGWLNAWELPEFHSWASSNVPLFAIWNNIIHWPSHMALYMLPREAKDKIINKWDQHAWGKYSADIEGIKTFMLSKQPSDDEIRMQYKTFLKHDALRNENILTLIPEELELLKSYLLT